MKRVLIGCIFLLNVLISCTPEKDQAPNVLILLSDDMGYTDLACYGGAANSPNLDGLAEKGIKFTHFYAPAPNCSPSRTGLLTGRMPSKAGMYNYRKDGHSMHLPDKELTIAELLKTNGYQTAHFGKWHLSCLPQDPVLNQPQPVDQGFDYSLGTENNAEPSHLNPVNFVRNGQLLGETKGYSCQILAREVKQWFRNTFVKDKPFFIYVAFHEVHSKIASPEAMVQNYPDVDRKEAEYLANVENMDDAVGKILAELKDRELLENTLVIFASDNGPENPGKKGNLRGMKSEVYEGGIRVPGIFCWENKIKSGSVCQTPAGLIDVLPTLVVTCGASLGEERDLDGTDLTPLFEQKDIQREKPLTWFFYRSFPEISMRVDDYVLIGNALDSVPRTHPTTDIDMDFIKNIEIREFELYNIKTDPGQTNDLVEKEVELFAQMKPQLLKVLEEIKKEGPYWENLFEYEDFPSKFKKKYIRKPHR